MLVLQRVCVSHGSEPVVQHASLRVANPGLLFVVGAGGAGKSSLLACLAGAGAQAGLTHRGSAELDGVDLFTGAMDSSWVPQHARLGLDERCGDLLCAQLGLSFWTLSQWLREHGLEDEVGAFLDREVTAMPRSLRRLLSVLVGLHAQVPLYLLDEPTAELKAQHVAVVHACLARISQRAMVIVATHNRQDCLALGGHTALLAGGAIQECAPSAQFFGHPGTTAGRTYVETGNCNLPRVGSLGRNPNGIWWAVPGLLCGMSRPGLVATAEEQYLSLSARGVRHLVCLEETRDYPSSGMRALDIAQLHFPVPDMAPPSFAQAVDLCRAVELPICRNEGIAVHCRGGLGRTGTALAIILVWFGDDADTAIGKVRRGHPLAIQTLAQSRFVHEFADRIRGWQRPETQPAQTQPQEYTDVTR